MGELLEWKISQRWDSFQVLLKGYFWINSFFREEGDVKDTASFWVFFSIFFWRSFWKSLKHGPVNLNFSECDLLIFLIPYELCFATKWQDILYLPI